MKFNCALSTEEVTLNFAPDTLFVPNVFTANVDALNEYFEVTNKVEADNPFDTSHYEGQQGKLVRLIKDFILKDAISISKGVQFIHFVDNTGKGIFHDLLTIEKREKVLRMKNVEFVEYFM